MRRPSQACPACGFVVFEQEPGSHELCPVCNWENDGAQYADPNLRGGANAESLVEAQRGSVGGLLHGTMTFGEWERDPWWRPLMEVEVAAGSAAVTLPTDTEPFVPYWSRSPLGWNTLLDCDHWYDGPIAGIANVDGRAHVFTATWDEAADEWNHWRVELRATDDVMVTLVLERSRIWKRSTDARMRGEDVAVFHPALPADRARYELVRAELTEKRALA